MLMKLIVLWNSWLSVKKFLNSLDILSTEYTNISCFSLISLAKIAVLEKFRRS
jgi:hypothetical protein